MRKKTADLTQGSLSHHLKRLAIPSSTGFLFNTMYNVVDTFWAGRISADSLASLSLNFPVYMTAMALGIGFSAAAGALVANSIGAGKEREAKLFHAQSKSFTLIASASAAVILFLLLKPVFIMLNAEKEVLEGALSYGRIIIIGMPVLNMVPVAASGLTARGDTVSYRNALFAGLVMNIGLDPLFIYVFGMGTAGVAMATILIQIIILIYMFARLAGAEALSGLVLRDFKPLINYYRQIISQAVPASANFLTMALGVFVITWFISAFGSNAVAAYGAAVRVEQIALVPTAGLSTALAAMTGQNNGAGRMDRVIKSFKLTLIGGAVIMILILPPVLIFGRTIIGFFTDVDEVIAMGYEYLLLQGITYYSYIILFQSNSVLQGLKKPGMIMWVGLYRQIVAPAGIFYLFCFVLGMQEAGVWRGLILINWSAAVITLLWAMRVFRQSCSECFDKDDSA